MKSLLKSLKGKIVLGAAAASVVALGIAAIILLSGEESYRSIVAKEVSGSAVLTNDKKTAEAIYEGQSLYDGDMVSVGEDSYLTMELDLDKYVLAEANSKFRLEAKGEDGSGKTTIYLEEGAVLNRLKNRLNEDESYEVSTPNATMAVRGTVFRITVYVGEDGLNYTLLEVLNGAVEVALKTEDGEFNGVAEIIQQGQGVLMRGNTEFSEFVAGEDGEIIREIEYDSLPQITAQYLVEYADDGELYEITKELLMDLAGLEEHKMVETISEEAGCTESGLLERVCSVCGREKETVDIPATGHTAGAWTELSAATCAEAGIEEQRCTECNAVIDTRETELLEHTAGAWTQTKAASCTEQGSEEQRCTVCNVLLATREVTVTGHVGGAWVQTKAPTCTTAGSEEQRCAVCGLFLGAREVAAVGHTEGEVETFPAPQPTVPPIPCTDIDIEQWKCAVCGEIIKSNKASHTWTHRDWSYEQVEEGQGNAIITLDVAVCSVCEAEHGTEQHEPEESADGLSVTCKTCGWTHLHDINTLSSLDWGECYCETCGKIMNESDAAVKF